MRPTTIFQKCYYQGKYRYELSFGTKHDPQTHQNQGGDDFHGYCSAQIVSSIPGGVFRQETDFYFRH